MLVLAQSLQEEIASLKKSYYTSLSSQNSQEQLHVEQIQQMKYDKETEEQDKLHLLGDLATLYGIESIQTKDVRSFILELSSHVKKINDHQNMILSNLQQELNVAQKAAQDWERGRNELQQSILSIFGKRNVQLLSPEQSSQHQLHVNTSDETQRIIETLDYELNAKQCFMYMYNYVKEWLQAMLNNKPFVPPQQIQQQLLDEGFIKQMNHMTARVSAITNDNIQLLEKVKQIQQTLATLFTEKGEVEELLKQESSKLRKEIQLRQTENVCVNENDILISHSL